jgi:hypothetical protein
MTMTNPKYCSAPKKDGSQCHGWPDASGLCPAHREDAHEIRVLGGLSRSKQHQLETRLPARMKPVLDLLGRAISETYGGTLKPSQASAIAALASALCKVSELSEFEVRLLYIEKRLKGKEEW